MPSLGTKDSERYSEIAVTTSVPVDVCAFSSVPLTPSDEGSWKESRKWTSVWLAAEATNRLVSVWSCSRGSMKSGQSEEQVPVRKPLELAFLNISRCSHIKLSFKMCKQ